MPQGKMPLSFTVRPANRGLNKSVPPQSIDVRESPSMFDVRFDKGQIRFRNGFRLKYKGVNESILWLDIVYSLTESQLIGITQNSMYYLNGDTFEPMDIWNASGVLISHPQFNMDPMIQYLAIDAGFGQYTCAGANGGAVFPVGGSYETITVLCNGTTDGVFIIIYGVAGAEAERCGGGICPTLGRSCAVWDGRIFIGGDENDNAKITWSSKGMLSDWTLESGAGFTIVGDSPDWIQAMRKLGEYLIVYKERSIFIGRQTFLVDPPVRFDPAPGQGIGLAAPNSVGDLGEEHIFLGWDNIYIFSLQKIEEIGTSIKDELFYGEHGILPKYLGNCTGVVAEEFDEYWLFVPTGKWPSRGDDEGGEEMGVSNLLSDPLCSDHTLWHASNSGTGTIDTVQTNAVLGANTISLYPDAGVGNYQGIREDIELGYSGTGHTFSLTVWVTAAEELTLHLYIQEVNAINTVLKTHTIDPILVSPEDGHTKFVRSVTFTEADTVRAYVHIRNHTPETTLYVDAVHLIDITDVDDKFLIDIDGHKTIGYIGPDNEPKEIPLIVDEVGPWNPDTVWVFNYGTQAWSCWRVPMTGFGYDSIQTIQTIAGLTGTIAQQTWRFDEKRVVDFAPTNLLAQADGQVYEMASGISHDFEGVLDRPFVAYWESKDFDLDRPDIEKTVSKITLYHETSHSPINVTVGVSLNSGLNWEEQDVLIAQGRTETYVTVFVTGPQVRFRIRAISPGFFISGFSIKLIPRGETNYYG